MGSALTHHSERTVSVMTSFWSLSHVRAHAWQWFLGVGMAMSLGYFLLPSAAVQDLAYQVPGMLAVVAIFVGIRLHRPARPAPLGSPGAPAWG